MGETSRLRIPRYATPVTRNGQWRVHAACLGADVEVFYPHKNTVIVPELIARTCEGCPVRPSCLAEALVYGEPGIWGGTTERQRATLRRRYRRSSCPACGPSLVIPFDNRQACTSCGLSWIVERARNNAGLVPV